MTEEEALKVMIAPGTLRDTKWRGGVIQIWITRACDKSCFGCTQGSNLKPSSKENMFISLENFEIAVESLVGYFGVVGIFGGNPALHPQFKEICDILTKHIPFEQRGLWCNNPMGKGAIMRKTFNPAYSNLNVHLDLKAYNEFRSDWPEAHPVGLTSDSRHSPVFAAMDDLVPLEEARWDLISTCDINKYWSALVGQFRGQPRAWFCEIAGSQSMLQQSNPLYPDTGIYPDPGWWRKPLEDFKHQVKFHCHKCGIPLRGYGELSQSENGVEQTTHSYSNMFDPKKKDRQVDVVYEISKLKPKALQKVTDYIGNGKK